MTLTEFKSDFALIQDGDLWGTALDAWFECAGQMYYRGMRIPDDWHYSTPTSDPRNEDSFFYESFNNASDKQLETIGSFLFRYCQLLKRHGKDY